MPTDNDPLARYGQSAKIWRDNHPELEPQNADWLARNGYSADNVIRLQQIQEAHPLLTAAVWEAALDADRRGVLMAVSWRDGAGYAALEEWLPRVPRRTLERRVATLKDAGIIVGEGKPVTYHFASEAAALLTEHVLALTDSVG